MTLSDAIIKRINDLMCIKNIKNPYQLALKSGLNEAVIRGVLSGRTSYPNLHTMYYIALGFDMSLSEFYNDKLFAVDNIDDNWYLL